MNPRAFVVLVLLTFFAPFAGGADYPLEDKELQNYFATRAHELTGRWKGKFTTLEEWEKARPQLRVELLEMLGLNPLPDRTDLQPKITGRLERDTFTVEKLHFQSLPGLFVTGNFYLPKERSGKLPAILYVCGHSHMTTNGISLGNKTGYQHHGAWFARNGYACLIIDTVQLGEIPGIHHGTYREGMWWWNSRGYTPAGIEAWNSMRAIDYLQSRPEVDGDKIGMTGRSGGGAYSWYTTAIDDRVKVAAPIAGITDRQNHIVDGVVEGHCDCMYAVNTYRWDDWLIAALVAPRPLLIGNTDKDTIFPLDGVQRLHAEVARIYKHYQKPNQLGLLITEGPHKDTQDLQVPVFRWFDRWLKGIDRQIEMPAVKEFNPMDLRVFAANPTEHRNGYIHETFVPKAPAPQFKSRADWDTFRRQALGFLGDNVFSAWRPIGQAINNETDGPFTIRTEDGIRISGHVKRGTANSKRVIVRVVDQIPKTIQAAEDTIYYVVPRARAERQSSKKDLNTVQVRRRYMLLGTTVDSMRAMDIVETVRFARLAPGHSDAQITIEAEGFDAVNAIYAALRSEAVRQLHLRNLPASHMSGPDYLGVLRMLDIPVLLAMVAQDRQVIVSNSDSAKFEIAKEIVALTGSAQNLVFQ